MNTKNYEITNFDGKTTVITETDFNEALSSGKYHRYDIDSTLCENRRRICVHNTENISVASGTNSAEQYSRATYNGNMNGTVLG